MRKAIVLVLLAFMPFFKMMAQPGCSFVFNGSNYITAGAAPGLGLGIFTIECWFNRTGAGITANTGSGGVNAIPLVTKGRGEQDGSNLDMNYFLGIRGTDSVLIADFEEGTSSVSPGLNQPIIGTTRIKNNRWYHAALTFDGSNYRIYLNGNLEASLTLNRTPQQNSIQHFSVGSALNSTGVAQGYFVGSMDEVRVWSVARTSDSITASINQQLKQPRANLVGRFSFDNCNGAGSRDSVGSVGTVWSVIGLPNYGTAAAFNIRSNTAPPAKPSLIASTNAVCPNQQLQLKAKGSDPDQSRVNVKIFGRILVDGSKEKAFTIAGLPDTQFYTSHQNGGHNNQFKAQTRWLARVRDSLNIAFVAQVGDLVQNDQNNGNPIEFLRADTAMKILDAAANQKHPDGIPYSVSIGNHDQNPQGDYTGSTGLFNQYFGVNRYNTKYWWGGSYRPNEVDQHFMLFSEGSYDFLLISIEFGATANAGILNWADSLCKVFPLRKVIVVTHYGMELLGTHSAQGSAIINRLRGNPNLWLMLSGHVCGENSRQDIYPTHRVTSILMDYQCRTSGGDGWLQFIELLPSVDAMRVRTYSPTLRRYETDANSQFVRTSGLNTTAFMVLKQDPSQGSGDTLRFTYPNLRPGQQLQLFASVTDSSGRSTNSDTIIIGTQAKPQGRLRIDATALPTLKCWVDGKTNKDQQGNWFVNTAPQGAVDTLFTTYTPGMRIATDLINPCGILSIDSVLNLTSTRRLIGAAKWLTITNHSIINSGKANPAIVVFDLSGKQITLWQWPAGQAFKPSLPDGVYILRATGHTTKRLLIANGQAAALD